MLFIVEMNLSLQEDLTEKDTEEIIDDLKAGREPKAGPRYISLPSFKFWILKIKWAWCFPGMDVSPLSLVTDLHLLRNLLQAQDLKFNPACKQ